MARVTDITFDKVAVGQLLRTPEMEAEMVWRGETVMALAISTAPVGRDEDPHAGRYKESFNLEHGLEGCPGTTVLSDRAWCTVSNDAPEAIFVEYGNKNTPRYHTLLNAMIVGAQD